MKERNLNPLGMNATSATLNGLDIAKDLALPHVKAASMPHQNFDNALGAVGINSNINDLANWMKMWLGSGKFGDKQLISSASVAACRLAEKGK